MTRPFRFVLSGLLCPLSLLLRPFIVPLVADSQLGSKITRAPADAGALETERDCAYRVSVSFPVMRLPSSAYRYRYTPSGTSAPD